jgi:uncharacterized protein YbjT (DUF2867 family)
MILVTGATGFIGSNLVRHLSAANVAVAAFARDGVKTPRIELPGVKVVRGDVLRAGTLEYSMADCNCVVHLVGIIRETKTFTFQQAHVEATKNALAAAKKKGISRFVYVSALGARDGAKSKYLRTKWQAEEAVRASGLNWTIVRPSVVYGPHGAFFDSMLAMTRGTFTPIIKPGMNTGLLQPIHIDDLAACLVKIATDESGATFGKVFECGGPNRLTTEAILETIAQLSGNKIRKVSVPLGFAKIAMGIGGKLGVKTPATPEQLQMLRENNVCNESVLKNEFGIAPRAFRDGVRDSLSKK